MTSDGKSRRRIFPDWGTLIFVFLCPYCDIVWSELDFPPGCDCGAGEWAVGMIQFRTYLSYVLPKWMEIM